MMKISYHILRTGKPYNGSRYHWNTHQTKMVKQLRRAAARAHDLASEIHTSEIDDWVQHTNLSRLTTGRDDDIEYAVVSMNSGNPYGCGEIWTKIL